MQIATREGYKKNMLQSVNKKKLYNQCRNRLIDTKREKERKKERFSHHFDDNFLCIKSNDVYIHQVILSVSWLNL